MKIFSLFLFITLFHFISTLFHVEQKDVICFLQSFPFRYIKQYSYSGMLYKIRAMGKDYSIRQYVIQAAILGSLCGLLCYATIQHLVYSLLIASLAIFFLPFLIYLDLKRKVEEMIEKEMLTYVSTAILYLREKKNSLRLLKDCAEIVQNPLQQDLKICIEKIEETSNYSLCLDELERKYPYCQVRNLHLLLKGKKLEGGHNEQLIDYLFSNTEESELLINDYRQKKEANRSVFYFMLILNLLAVLVMKKMFHSSTYVDLSTTGFQLSVFLFYLMNATTVLYYEHWCSRNDKLE